MKKKTITSSVIAILLAGVATVTAQTYCPYTGRPMSPPMPGQTTQYTQPVNFDNQKMMQQQIQRATLLANQNLQRDSLGVQHRIQSLQLEYSFKQPASPMDAQQLQQQLQQLQQEQQGIQLRHQEEVRRIQAMR